MTPAEKLAALHRWHAAMDKSNALINPVIEVMQLPPESPVVEAVWGLQDALTVAMAAQVGDAWGHLSWHAHENALGQNGYEAGPDGKMRAIRTLEDLLWLIDGVQA